jgi:hypothetical protein
VLVGTAVAVTLVLFGAVAGQPQNLPAWGLQCPDVQGVLSSGVLALVGVQLVTALWIYWRLRPSVGR